MNAVSSRTTDSAKARVYNTGNFTKFVHYSEDLENAIIGICLIEVDKILEVMNYIKTPEVFYFDTNKIIFEAMVQLTRKGLGVSLVSVPIEIMKFGTFDQNEFGHVKWDLECAIKMRDVTGSEHLMQWSMYLIQFYVHREQINHAMNIWNESNPMEAAKRLNDRINFALSFNAVTDWHSVGDIMMELVDRRERIRKGENFGVPTGFAEIDELTGGGIETGFHVICARPAMGKTAFALSMAINMATFGISSEIIPTV